MLVLTIQLIMLCALCVLSLRYLQSRSGSHFFVIRPDVDAMFQALNLQAFYESGGQMVVVIGSPQRLGWHIEGAVVGPAKLKFTQKSFGKVIVDGVSTDTMILKKKKPSVWERLARLVPRV